MKPPPKELRLLLDGTDPDSRYLFKHIRLINSNLAFAGLSANERDMPSGHGPPIVRMHGAVYHVIGSLFPAEDVSKFVSIYIYDPEMELANRLRHSLDDVAMKRILGKLQPMLHTCNPLIAAFKTAVEQMQDHTDGYYYYYYYYYFNYYN